MEPEKSRMTSASLIEGMQAGREDAWLRMVRLFGPHVFQWIRSLANNKLQPHDITDISQDVFMGATESIPSYKHSEEVDGSFRRWLYGITRNKVFQFFRTNSRVPLPIDNIDQLPQLNPEAPLDDIEGEIWNLKPGRTHKAVEIIRSKSEAHTWQAFWRTVVNGEETADVAEDLGMNSQAVRQARHRIKQNLIKAVAKLDQENQEQ